jgi:hypothetical protein
MGNLSREESRDIQRQMKLAIYRRDHGMLDPVREQIRKEVEIEKKAEENKKKYDFTKLSSHNPNLEVPKGYMVTFFKKGLPKMKRRRKKK